MNSDTHKKLLYGLGLLVTSFGTLESYMQVALSALLTRHQDIGMMVASCLSFDKRIQLFVAICQRKIKTPGLLKELKCLCRKLNHAEGERNKLLHSNYLAGMEPESVTRMKVGVKAKKVMHEVRPEDLFSLAASFNALYEEFYTFFGKLHDAAINQDVLLYEAFDI